MLLSLFRFQVVLLIRLFFFSEARHTSQFLSHRFSLVEHGIFLSHMAGVHHSVRGTRAAVWALHIEGPVFHSGFLEPCGLCMPHGKCHCKTGRVVVLRPKARRDCPLALRWGWAGPAEAPLPCPAGS